MFTNHCGRGIILVHGRGAVYAGNLRLTRESRNFWMQHTKTQTFSKKQDILYRDSFYKWKSLHCMQNKCLWKLCVIALVTTPKYDSGIMSSWSWTPLYCAIVLSFLCSPRHKKSYDDDESMLRPRTLSAMWAQRSRGGTVVLRLILQKTGRTKNFIDRHSICVCVFVYNYCITFSNLKLHYYHVCMC